MEILCGTCSQEKGLPIEERMKLARSRQVNVVYICPTCKREHVHQGVVKKAGPPVEAPKEEEPNLSKSSNKKVEEGDQLSLF
ncbi:hypothetical protein [Ammoniphilus resinae]|uniref:DNA-directed RNA polymerase subunit RPC12/RpoP n=1 Tax=Ammoniphilus resinae TaxID=861532 RepID=A0ABS4GW70_9BACL|nr:hypothetical protein [Ammoniphilus resinae]MBP1934524.1 DNA-directed RNA polymerase subunit RPC12/RpoP [Ammoniphilus resinae]